MDTHSFRIHKDLWSLVVVYRQCTWKKTLLQCKILRSHSFYKNRDEQNYVCLYCTEKNISLPEKAKTKIIWNLCSKRNIYKAAKNIGTAKYVLFCIEHGKTWDLLSNLTHSTGLNIKINTHFQFLTTTGSHLVYLLSIYCWYR